MKFILGYDIDDDCKCETLTQYNTVEEASFNSEEWCIVDAKTLEEAKAKYEETFLKLNKDVTVKNIMLSNEDIADHLLSDMQAYKENIREIIIGRLMDSSCQRTYWDAWFRGATGKDLENAEKGIFYNQLK
jgi:hypothetical protein